LYQPVPPDNPSLKNGPNFIEGLTSSIVNEFGPISSYSPIDDILYKTGVPRLETTRQIAGNSIPECSKKLAVNMSSRWFTATNRTIQAISKGFGKR